MVPFNPGQMQVATRWQLHFSESHDTSPVNQGQRATILASGGNTRRLLRRPGEANLWAICALLESRNERIMRNSKKRSYHSAFASPGLSEATIVSVKSLPAGKGAACRSTSAKHWQACLSLLVASVNWVSAQAATQWLLQFSTAEETKYIHETLGGNIPQGLQNPVAIRPAGSGQEAMEDQRSVQMLPGKGKGKTDFPPHVTLYVTGLPLGSNEDSLREFFVQYGDVYSSKVLPVSGGKSTMAGFVRMPEFEGGWCVENLNNFQPEGYSMPLQVTFPKDSPDKGMGKGGMANKGDHEAYAMSNGGSAFGKGDYTDFKGDSSKSWNDKGAWGNGHDANEVKSVFSGGKGSWSWDKGSSKGAAQGKDSKGWGKEKGSDKGNWGWDSGWGKGCGKATKGKGKKPGPY